jgi:hypothetical protein
MPYIVVETFPIECSAVVVEEEFGKVLIFDDKEAADKEATECQRGVVLLV